MSVFIPPIMVSPWLTGGMQSLPDYSGKRYPPQLKRVRSKRRLRWSGEAGRVLFYRATGSRIIDGDEGDLEILQFIVPDEIIPIRYAGKRVHVVRGDH